MAKDSSNRGKDAEQFAEQLLLDAGCITLERNFSSAFGEIDLIMFHENTLLFVEVRLRTHPRFAQAAETVNTRKQLKIRQTAEVYLQKHPYNCPCRFDVIAVSLNAQGFNAEWIQNAFE